MARDRVYPLVQSGIDLNNGGFVETGWIEVQPHQGIGFLDCELCTNSETGRGVYEQNLQWSDERSQEYLSASWSRSNRQLEMVSQAAV